MQHKAKFDESIDKVLLRNGFAYYGDWKHGPIANIESDYDHVSIKLFKHDYGYWIIFHRHASGKNIETNIGSSNSAKDIIRLLDSLLLCKD